MYEEKIRMAGGAEMERPMLSFEKEVAEVTELLNLLEEKLRPVIASFPVPSELAKTAEPMTELQKALSPLKYKIRRILDNVVL